MSGTHRKDTTITHILFPNNTTINHDSIIGYTTTRLRESTISVQVITPAGPVDTGIEITVTETWVDGAPTNGGLGAKVARQVVIALAGIDATGAVFDVNNTINRVAVVACGASNYQVAYDLNGRISIG